MLMIDACIYNKSNNFTNIPITLYVSVCFYSIQYQITQQFQTNKELELGRLLVYSIDGVCKQVTLKCKLARAAFLSNVAAAKLLRI